MPLECEQHFDRRAATVKIDQHGAFQLLSMLESATEKTNEGEMFLGFLRGMTARWADEAKAKKPRRP